MADIVLTTLNAKYIHAAFGLRYLLANLGPLRERAALVEFDINQRPLDIAEVLLARTPKILGFQIFFHESFNKQRVVAISQPSCQNKTVVQALNVFVQEIFNVRFHEVGVIGFVEPAHQNESRIAQCPVIV